MQYIEETKIENIFPQLDNNVIKLSESLLSVDWTEFDFDRTEKINHSLFSNIQKQQIDLIIQNIPEWKRLINCKQHITHDFCLDIHTLVVIKKLQETEEYKQLNLYNKLLILYAALLHDIEKNEKVVDPDHPAKGAYTARLILTRLGFDENFINDVYTLIKNHQLLGQFAANRIKLDAHQVAEIIKTPTLMDLFAVLAIADIKAVKKNNAFIDSKIKKNIEIIKAEVKDLIRKIS